MSVGDQLHPLSHPEDSQRRSPPQSIGSYRILGVLGKGGMGVVYQAEHKETGERVALKTVSVPSRARRQGIRDEILALRRLQHPRIVRILDSGVANGGVPWYAMELLQGKTFGDWLAEVWPEQHESETWTTASPGPPAPTEAHNWSAEPSVYSLGPALTGRRTTSLPTAGRGQLQQILDRFRMLCDALCYLHGRAIVHRDIKPANVFLCADGRLVLMDFGLISRARGSVGRETLEAGGHLAGTMAYLSPEQIRRDTIDARTDLYALGCMLYESVTGVVPFRAKDPSQLMAQHLYEPPAPPSSLVEGLDPRLERLILSLLAKDRRHRLGHADEVARVLAQIDGVRDLSELVLDAPAFLYRPEVVDRDDVLTSLDESLDRLQTRKGSFVLLAGESGIGKTFLATEVARRAGIRGMRVVTAECSHRGTLTAVSGGTVDRLGLPLQPLRPLLTAIVDFCGDGGAVRAERMFGADARVIAAQVSTLGSLAGLESIPVSPGLSAEEGHRRLVESLLRVLSAFASEGSPLLWILDDIQWADELSLNLLLAMDLPWLEKSGIMILCTYRTDEIGRGLRQLIERPDVQNVVLSRMSTESVGRMAADMLAIPALPPAVQKFLATQTEGVPFFVAEYLRAALCEGLLSRRGGYWQLEDGDLSEADLRALPLPHKIHDIMVRRLAQVDEDLRTVVELAAVVGREADVELIASALDPTNSAATVDQTLDRVRELIRLQILDSPESGRYRFVHDKLRETIYDALPSERRSELHRDIARLLEAKLRNRKETPPFSDVAHHFLQGRLWDKALDYLERAGEQAFASFAHHEAIGFFTRALGLADRASVGITRLRLATWERRLVDAHLALGDMASAHEHADRALGHCGFALPSLRAGWVVGLFGQIGRRMVQRLWPAAFRVRSPDSRSLINEAAYVLNRLCEPFFLAHRPLEGFYCGFFDLNLAERVPPSEALARGYATMAMVVGVGPFAKVGARWSDRAIEIARALRVPSSLTYCLSRAGSVHGSQARWETSLERITEAEALARTQADLRQLGETVTLRGLINGFRGSLEESLVAAQEVIAIGKVRGDRQLVNWGQNLSVHALVRLGRAREATDLVSQMTRHHQSTTTGDAEKIFDFGGFALHALALGDFTEAHQHARHVLEAIRRERFLPYFLKLGLDATCEVLLSLLERIDSAADGARRLRSEAREIVARLQKFAALYPMARPRALIYQAKLSALLGRHRAASSKWAKALTAAKTLRMPHDAGRAHLEIGIRLQAGQNEGHDQDRDQDGTSSEEHVRTGAELLRAASARLELDWLESRVALTPARIASAS